MVVIGGRERQVDVRKSDPFREDPVLTSEGQSGYRESTNQSPLGPPFFRVFDPLPFRTQ